MTQGVFNGKTPKVLSKKFFIDITYDLDNEGKKTDAHLDVPEFSLAGFQWTLSTRKFIYDKDFSFGLWMEMNKAYERKLARGYNIKFRCTWIGSTSNGQVCDNGTQLIGFPRKFPIKVFKSCIDHLDLSFELVDLEDIYPHRLQFIEGTGTEEAEEEGKIILKDDEDKVVFVDKEVLAESSPFFKSLFYGNFKEKNLEEVPLHGVKQDDFLEYLYAVFPPKRRLTLNRIETILPLADRFRNEKLLAKIEEFLLKMQHWKPKWKCRVLVWADTYRMRNLFIQTLASISEKDLTCLQLDECLRKFSQDNARLLQAHVSLLTDVEMISD